MIVVFVVLVAALIVCNAVTLGYLVYDRQRQKERDSDQRKREGEFYHTMRDTLAPLVGQFALLKQITQRLSSEIKTEVQKNPPITAALVVDAMSHPPDGSKPGSKPG